MRPGGLTCTAPGHVRDLLRVFKFEKVGNQSLMVTLEATDMGMGRYYQLYIGGVAIEPLIYYPPDHVGPLKVARLYGDNSNGSVSIEDFGQWSRNPYPRDTYTYINEDEEDTSKRLRFSWNPPTNFSYTKGSISAPEENNKAFSALLLSGFKRFTNLVGDTEPFRGSIFYSRTVTNGSVNYSFFNSLEADDDNLIASGDSSTLAFTIDEENGSGVSGTLTMAGLNHIIDAPGLVPPVSGHIKPLDGSGINQSDTTTLQVNITDSGGNSISAALAQVGLNTIIKLRDATTGGTVHYQVTASSPSGSIYFLTVTWLSSSGVMTNGNVCATFYTHEDTLRILWPEQYQIHYSTSVMSFPRTPEATMEEEGTDDFYYATPNLAAGSYYAVVVPVINGIPQSTGITPSSGLVIEALPTAPTLGSTTQVTPGTAVLHWTAGVAGCTYKIYYSLVDEPINFGSFATPAAITTALNATSQSLTLPDYPGKYRAVVQAVKAGVEEHNGIEIEIVLDSSGLLVSSAPNDAAIKKTTSTGLDLTIVAQQDIIDEAAAATHVILSCKPIGTALNFTSPEATTTLDQVLPLYKEGTLTYTVPAAGWYHFAVKARTAAGVVSDNYVEAIEYFSADAPASPGNLIITTGN